MGGDDISCARGSTGGGNLVSNVVFTVAGCCSFLVPAGDAVPLAVGSGTEVSAQAVGCFSADADICTGGIGGIAIDKTGYGQSCIGTHIDAATVGGCGVSCDDAVRHSQGCIGSGIDATAVGGGVAGNGDVVQCQTAISRDIDCSTVIIGVASGGPESAATAGDCAVLNRYSSFDLKDSAIHAGDGIATQIDCDVGADGDVFRNVLQQGDGVTGGGGIDGFLKGVVLYAGRIVDSNT